MAKIKVTQKHIDEGVRVDPQCCPIALAICEQLALLSVNDVSVAGTRIRVRDRFISIPSVAKDFVNKYDSWLPVSPFEFELEGA